jgi:hypothetical protein
MGKRNMKWIGSEPVRCDICGHRYTPADRFFFDFRTRSGSWALGCESCFNRYGCGLGVGNGQKYDLKTRLKVSEPTGIEPVHSLGELRSRAESDDNYRRLLCLSSANLGGPCEGVEQCFQWLVANALETNEEGVVGEVNGCIDLVTTNTNREVPT